MNSQELWQAILGEMELLISKAGFTAWFKQTSLDSCSNNKLVIKVPNAYTKSWFEKKYTQLIKDIVKNITGEEDIKITYTISTDKKDKKQNISSTASPKQNVSYQTNYQTNSFYNLNPRYTFQNFIIGKGNELAHAAAKAIVKKPGEAYNPLFIYGGVGLGKTHLIQAVGNAILEKYPEKKVLYIPCEKFINDFLNALSLNNTENFKEKYRNVDVLLVDDIQFLSGKEQTQEAFFHTFNDLHQANKQILLTSDRPPKSIPTLEDRLISRFEWGMIADISTPDLETRAAILKQKAKEKNFYLNNEITEFVAANITNNVRELEGVLNKIIAFHEIQNIPPTINSVQRILFTYRPSFNKVVTTKDVIKTIANFYNIKQEDLISTSRKKSLVVPRQITMYIIREELKYSFPVIAQELNKKDHTTVIYGYEKIKKEIENNEQLKQEINLLKEKIYNDNL